MFELFKEPKIDFMGKKWLWIGISLITITFSLIFVPTHGIKQAVEFTGGAEVVLRYVDTPQLDPIRKTLDDTPGLTSVSVTTLSDTFANETEKGREVVIRVGLGDQGAGGERDLARRITEALRPPEFKQRVDRGQLDLNTADQVTIAGRLVRDAGLAQADADKAADTLTAYRREHGGVYRDLTEAKKAVGTGAVADWIEKNSFAGPFGLRGQQVIDGSVSGEMRSKALWATLGALLGMLLYIWFRFHFQWGLGAIVALIHDTIFTLGLFSLSGYEANLPVVAAFLTLIGYSNNDTVVIFDRIRENMKIRGNAKFEETINLSINQTLSRTIITSFLTWVSVLFLYLFGGPVLRPFAFVLLVGIIVGTYSSIYIAAPILTIWLKIFKKKEEVQVVAATAGRAKARPRG